MKASVAVESLDWQMVIYTVVLLALGVVVLILEFFVISFGLLSVVSLACVASAIYLAFLAHDAIGWTMIVTTPILAYYVVRWGLRRIQTSRLVPQAEITSEAGYHHVADRLGIAAGSAGVMVTAARPSGRARFPGGECDVQVQGPAVERDARVVVLRIDGPIIFVGVAPEGPDISATNVR